MAEHQTHHHPDDSHDDHHEGHMGIPMYLLVFGVLVIGTIVTYLVALVDLDGIFPGANTLVALTIAFVKMSFVVWFFMHVKYSSKLIWLTAVSGIFWLVLMFAFTMQDYLTRGSGLFTN